MMLDAATTQGCPFWVTTTRRKLERWWRIYKGDKREIREGDENICGYFLDKGERGASSTRAKILA
jgi:hypothetical protein